MVTVQSRPGGTHQVAGSPQPPDCQDGALFSVPSCARVKAHRECDTCVVKGKQEDGFIHSCPAE
jgi:hypothetical protein